MTITKYGLRHKITKELMEMYCSSQQGLGDAGCNTRGSTSGSALFTSDSQAHVEHLLAEPTPWYNSGHDSPEISDPQNWEIVTLVIQVEAI